MLTGTAWKLCATLAGAAAGIIASVLAVSMAVAETDDAPTLRTISGRDQVVINDEVTDSLKKVASNAGAKTGSANKAGSVDRTGAGAATEKMLPVSDITLPAPTAMPSAKKSAIASRIAGILAEKSVRNTTVGIEVRDLDEGSVVYSNNGDRLLKPASNNKLLTTAAALHILGGDHQFVTTVNAEGRIEHGVLHGDLHVYIDHDFTWSTRFYSTNGTPLRGLLQQIRSAGINRIDGRLIMSGYVVYGGKATDVLNPAFHLRTAANQFAGLLKKEKLPFKSLLVDQNNSKLTGKTVAVWKSPVLSEAIVPLNRSSNNLFADMLMMAIGKHDSGKNTYAAGAAAVQKWLKSSGIAAKGVVQHDGSGLSHDNRMTPHFFNDLTQYMLHSKYAREWAASLSISGYDGTYGGRLATDDAVGRVYAKSGTLRDVISSTGFFVNAANGHTYAFSMIVNNMRQKKNTRSVLDRIVRQFLGDNDQKPRPAIPMMQSLRREADGRVVARWDQIAGVRGYRVYTSVDDGTWVRRAETKDTALVLPDEPVQVRVTSVQPDGAESNSSLAFSYRPGSVRWTIVDAARCRSDAAMRPTNHFFTHERSLANVLPEKYGVETVRDIEKASAGTKGILWHDVACAGRLVSTDEAISRANGLKLPFILNIVDPQNAVERTNECAPAVGKYIGCYADGVVTMDRRIGARADNMRQRKAAGSFSSRPSSVRKWNGASSCLEMADASVAMCAKQLAIVGVDLEALDSARTQARIASYLKLP